MIFLTTISLQTHASLVNIRNKVWFVAHELGLSQIESSRLASVCAQIGRDFIESGIHVELDLHVQHEEIRELHSPQHLLLTFKPWDIAHMPAHISLRYEGLATSITVQHGKLTLQQSLRRHDVDDQLCQQVIDRMRHNVLPSRAELEMMASHDELTNVLNRHAFNDRYRAEFQRSCRYSLSMCLLMLDIDHFKMVNDTYGHPGGDACLIALAAKLRETAREQDIIARFGGEEFILLLPHTKPSEATVVAERIRAAVEAMHIQYAEHAIHCTVSIGISSYTDGKICDCECLLKQADQALYQAKNAGRNRVVSAPDKLHQRPTDSESR